MNQKGIHGQNDSSSNIIGNLPKRLQQKIAVDFNSDKHERDIAQVAPPVYGVKPAKHDECDLMPTVSILLRKKEEHKQTTQLNNVRHAENKLIPGIIHLKTTVSACLNSEDGSMQTQCIIPTRMQRNENHRNNPISPNAGSGHRSIKYPTWFNGLNSQLSRKMFPLYDTFLSIVQNNVTLVENWSTFCEVHAQLRLLFGQLLVTNLKLCCENKVDTFFWKLLFYNVREYLNVQNSPIALNCILRLIDEGMLFYKDLHMQLLSKYLTFDTTTSSLIAEQCNFKDKTIHKYEIIAKVAAQKILICLGDLNRYKVKHLNLNDYSEAKKFYKEAQQLIPTNGIPYNQLAVISILAHKKFDAVYFHMRSLMASNAIQSARESLLVLFDEIRKKYDESELKVSPNHQIAINQHSRTRSLRKEVWVFPDGIRRLHRSNLNNINNKLALYDEKRANEMSSENLLRIFISSYLYVIGKLYCGIGMESIHENQRKMLMQFKVILNRNPLSVKRSKLLKIVALNIFILQHNMSNESRRVFRHHSFCFCNQMFGFVVQKCNQLLQNHISDEPRSQKFIDLNTLLQYVNLYTQWLAQNVEVWEPVDEHACIHCWSEIQCLLPKLKKFCQQPMFNKAVSDWSSNEQLEEHKFIVGFTPLSSVSSVVLNHNALLNENETLNDNEQYRCRIQRILQFEKVYARNQTRLEEPTEMNFVAEKFNSPIQKAFDDYENGNALYAIVCTDDPNSESVDTTKSNSEIDTKKTENPNSETVAQISHLLKLKNELQAKTNVKQEYNDKLEKILNVVDSTVYIEVRPKYLLPDTNCFIDCLEDFEHINRDFKRYSLIVPLTVVKELDGLSKGVKLEVYEKSPQNHRIHHFDDVSTRAKKALNYIKSVKNYIKCATTKGSIIQASLFGLVEEEYASNDDKILATAVALAKNMNTETNKDGRCFIHTELVLITTDRNLRVKALSRNLAVSEMSEFLQWTRDVDLNLKF